MRSLERRALLCIVAATIMTACARGPGDPSASEGREPESAAHEAAPSHAEAVAEDRRSWVAVVLPASAVDIAPRTQGEIIAVHVQPGDPVAAGDPIATLDDRDAREALAMASAKLESVEAACVTAEVDLQEARQRLESERTLAAAGAASPSSVEAAQFAAKRAKAEHAQAEGARTEQRALVEQRRRQLGQTSIKAPISGTVVHRLRDVGAVVGPTMPIVRLIGTGPPRVRFAVPPKDATALAPGTRLVVEIETLASPLTARVRQIAGQLDRASHLVFIEADLLDLPHDSTFLRPGLPARVFLRREVTRPAR